MKTVKILTIILSGLFIFTQCSEDFLDKQPPQDFAQVEILSTYSGCENALIGAYSPFQWTGSYGRDAAAFPEVLANNVKKSEYKGSGRYISQYAFLFSPENTINLWFSAYTSIARANNVLEALPEITDAGDYSQAEINKLEAEARFLRGFCHFDLVKYYAQSYLFTANASHLGVPIITKTEIGEPARNTVKEVYDFVIEDLNFAAENLDNSKAPFFANRAAAYALLSRVYLYKGDWANAEIAATAALADVPNVYTATDWVNSWDEFGADEALFEISNNPASDSDVPGGGENYPSLYDYAGYGDLVLTEDVVNIFDPADIRGNIIISDPNGEYRCMKYTGYNGVVGIDNFIVIRVSEVYLNRAEARMEQNKGAEALADINMIRTNRGLTALAIVDIDDILLERRKELLLEGHMLFDFTRRGLDVDRGFDCYAEIDYVSYGSYLLAFPIPDDEVNANPNLVQNPNN